MCDSCVKAYGGPVDLSHLKRSEDYIKLIVQFLEQEPGGGPLDIVLGHYCVETVNLDFCLSDEAWSDDAKNSDLYIWAIMIINFMRPLKLKERVTLIDEAWKRVF